MRAAATPLRILLVDDSAPDVELLVEALHLTGVPLELTCVSEGAAVLDQPLEEVDLMVMALHLPGMDGFDVLKQLRAEKDLETLPVLALGAASAVEVQRAFDLRANEVAARGASFAEVQRLAQRIVQFAERTPSQAMG